MPICPHCERQHYSGVVCCYSSQDSFTWTSAVNRLEVPEIPPVRNVETCGCGGCEVQRKIFACDLAADRLQGLISINDELSQNYFASGYWLGANTARQSADYFAARKQDVMTVRLALEAGTPAHTLTLSVDYAHFRLVNEKPFTVFIGKIEK